MRATVNRVCETCGRLFAPLRNEVRRGGGRFCGRDCKQRHGPTLRERFWAKVDKSGPVPAHRPELGPCWVWTASGSLNGYGGFMTWRNGESRMWRAHRLAYLLMRRPIPKGWQIDHLCRNRRCVNPNHLEAVPWLVNWARGDSPSAVNARMTHCQKGHEYTPENTRLTPRGKRLCLVCQEAHGKARWQAIKAARAAMPVAGAS